MTFSKRMGLVPEKKPLQLNDMDEELRAELHNDIRQFEIRASGSIGLRVLYKKIWIKFLKNYIDEFTEDFFGENYMDQVIRFYRTLEWFRVYDYIEFYLDFVVNEMMVECVDLIRDLSATLERHNSAYRIVDYRFVPITNDTELEGLSQASNTGLKAIDHHMKQAIAIFSQKESKDYRNVIKEAMSAVEATVNHVNGTKGKTLGDALKQLDQKRHIHEAMKSAFDKLYGYTSDTNSGIRHGLTDDADSIPGFAEAKFMIVACSAFINWLQCREAE